MILANNIRYLRKKYNYSQDKLAELLGYKSFTTIQKWESGVAEPPFKTLAKLAEIFRVDIDDLAKVDLSTVSLLHSSAPATTSTIRIPVFGRIPAGVPLEAIEDICGYEEMSAQLAESDKEYFALEIRGDSMYPKYMDGDIVIFERQSDCESGDDCAVRINGDDATFKKIRKQQFGITLQPINPDYEPIQIDYGDPDQPIEILGIAKEIRRKV